MSNKSIMIVEDEIMTARSMALLLKDMGYSISSIQTKGTTAVTAAIQERPDVILMDINLNGNIDGIEVAELIHSSVFIPIIYVTGYSDSETLERANKTNPHGFIIKPINFDTLKLLIDEVFMKKNDP